MQELFTSQICANLVLHQHYSNVAAVEVVFLLYNKGNEVLIQSSMSVVHIVLSLSDLIHFLHAQNLTIGLLVYGAQCILRNTG